MVNNKLNYRNEFKFLCPEHEMMILEQGLKLFCKLDRHVNSSGKYLVRSLYFDSPDDVCYWQTKNGVDHRSKYRIRTYDNSDGLISLERKESQHGKKRKTTQTISKEELNDILTGHELLQTDKTVLCKFIADCRSNCLTPKVVVQYVRTPYVYPVGNVRITFDQMLYAGRPEDFFAQSMRGISVMTKGWGILEVKYDDLLPGSIARYLNGFQLQTISFSKYVNCREAMAGIFSEEFP